MIARWTTGVVGGLLVLLNAVHLSIGFVRLQRALAAEPIPVRFSEALQTAWLYLGSFGLAVGCLLLWLLPDLAAGSTGAWKAVAGIGIALIAVGVASFLATRNHPGLLIVAVLGIALLLPLLLDRARFHH